MSSVSAMWVSADQSVAHDLITAPILQTVNRRWAQVAANTTHLFNQAADVAAHLLQLRDDRGLSRLTALNRLEQIVYAEQVLNCLVMQLACQPFSFLLALG